MIKKYFVKSTNEPELIDCPVCNGTGVIKGTLTSEALDAPIENTTLSCPKCNGSGKVSTGKVLHYAVGTVFIYGDATVTDNGETQDYLLGFVCNDEQIIKDYKEKNGISSFVKVPGALVFYGKGDTLYDTYEEAEAAMKIEEENWSPDLKVVEPES